MSAFTANEDGVSHALTSLQTESAIIIKIGREVVELGLHGYRF